jgi:hypothetical protein
MFWMSSHPSGVGTGVFMYQPLLVLGCGLPWGCMLYALLAAISTGKASLCFEESPHLEMQILAVDPGLRHRSGKAQLAWVVW